MVFGFELLDMRIPAQTDMGMALAIHMCRLNYGEDLTPIAVNIVHPEPSCAEEYYTLYKAPVRFSADRDSWLKSPFFWVSQIKVLSRGPSSGGVVSLRVRPGNPKRGK